MNINYIKRKLVRKLHLGALFYEIENMVTPDDVAKKYDSKELEKYVNNVHHDTGESCLCTNSIEEPKYDLEIIVPVYNAEKYLRECMESILSQETSYTYHVTCVNDGSTDNSRIILKEYADDSRVSIIDKKNGGASAARNTALKQIYARYVTFVDADDRLHNGAIQSLMDVAIKEDVDIVRGGHLYFDVNRIQYVTSYKQEKCEPYKTVGIACGIVYRATLWRKLCYPKGYWYEDTNCFVIASVANTAYTIDSIVYDYRKNNVSMTHIGIGNVKSVDSYYVTKKVLADIKSLDKLDSQELYECMLHQLLTNFLRITDIGDRKLDKAIFLLSCEMIEEYFPDKHSVTMQGKEIEQIVKERDFKHFKLNCMYRWI